MTFNSNTWNRIRYTFYTPIYDSVANIFKASRKRSIDSLAIKAGEKLLIIGAGTGLDLEFIPDSVHVVATDITPSMIEKIKNRKEGNRLTLEALVINGQKLLFENETFDKVILHLILAVIPDPKACIKEVDRILKPNGEVAIFDKFIPKNSKVSTIRRMANFLTNILFSDITRDLYSIIEGSDLNAISDVPANFKGHFRLIKLRKGVYNRQ